MHAKNRMSGEAGTNPRAQRLESWRRGLGVSVNLGARILAPMFIAHAAFADVVPIDLVRMSHGKEVGLVGFGDPTQNLLVLQKALRAYERGLRSLGAADDAGLLSPVEVVALGRCAVAPADAAAAQAAGAVSVAPTALAQRFDGIYGSVFEALRSRLDAYEKANAQAMSDEVKALFAGFRASASSDARLRLEESQLHVKFNVENDVAIFDANGAFTLPLPRVAALRGIESSSLPALVSQIEKAVEEPGYIPFGDGTGSPDFLVGAEVVQDPHSGRSVLEVKVGYVGPAGSPGIPVTSFALSFIGGDGNEIKGINDGGDYDLPRVAEVLAATTVRLYRVKDGDRTYLTDFAPNATAADAVDISLDQPLGQALGAANGGSVSLSIGALQTILSSIVETLKSDRLPDGGLIGVYADAAPGQVDMAQGGIESPNRSSKVFQIKVVPGVVGSFRVIAQGDRVSKEERVDPTDARFNRLKARSPFQPGVPASQVLRGKVLTEFLDRESRHPGRRVDAAITPMLPGAADVEGAAGTIGVDYLVTETKPWTVYGQIANTGTEATGEWMTRVGYLNTDLLGNDEIFSLEFLTTNLEDSNAVNTYFDAPVGDAESTRWKLMAGWNEYTASDVGFALADFEGSSPFAGVELAHNFYQDGKFFMDLVGGVMWNHVEVTNGLTNRTGEEDFYVPRIGLRAQRVAREATTDASLFFEYGLGADASQADLNALGRINADKDWQLIRWDLAHSFYLDPRLRDKNGSTAGTLAHELYFRARGQYALGNRLVPQFMAVGGGFYTVRGYPQSVVAGDNSYMATAEYRLHLPQILGFDPDPQPFFGVGDPFRLRPQFAYGSTDWDFILRGFVDVARITQSHKLSFEVDSTLLGVGVGAELKFMRNFNVRADLGFPLEDVQGIPIDDYQINIIGTISF